MLNKISTLIICFLFNVLILNGQVLRDDFSNFLTNPSTSVVKNVANDEHVDLYTGKINLGIPVYTIEQKDLKLPINLRYQTDGIKVADMTSWVGLGWMLQAAPFISRELRGNPDEHYDSGRFMYPPLASGNLSNCFPSLTSDDYVNLLSSNLPIVPCAISTGINPYCKEYVEYKVAQYLFSNSCLNDGCQYERRSEWGTADTEPDIFHYSLPLLA